MPAVAAAAHDVLVPLFGELPAEMLKPGCIDAGIASAEHTYNMPLLLFPSRQPRQRV